MRIVPLYAALLALLFVGLSLQTLRMRRRLRIAVGDAGNLAMLRAMRVHVCSGNVLNTFLSAVSSLMPRRIATETNSQSHALQSLSRPNSSTR